MIRLTIVFAMAMTVLSEDVALQAWLKIILGLAGAHVYLRQRDRLRKTL